MIRAALLLSVLPVVALAPASARAAGKASSNMSPARTAVVASGDCRDPELTSAAHRLSSGLARQPTVTVVSDDEVLERLGRAPSRSIEEIQRQIDTAQQLFYQAHYHKAVNHLESALTEIQRLPPGATRWQLWTSARVLEGLTRSRIKRDGGAEEAFRRVLRIDPNHTLDPDYFSPSTIKQFEAIRKELAASKKYPVKITSSPSGANLFIDGKLAGRTPATLSLPAGEYQVVVGRDETFSLPRSIRWDLSAEIHVDLKFESAIDTSRFTCIANPPNERTRLDSAVKLGSALELDSLVVLRFDRARVGPSWLAASLVNVRDAGKVREGGLQVGRDGVTDTGITELARFIATGEASPNVRPVGEMGATPPTAPVVSPAPRTSDTDDAPAFAADTGPSQLTDPVDASTATSVPSPTKRFAGQLLMGGGGALFLGGAVAQVMALGSTAEVARLREAGSPSPDQAAKLRAALDRNATEQTLALVGMGLGAVSAGVGAYLFFTNPDLPAGTSVAVLPGGEGASFVLSGTF